MSGEGFSRAELLGDGMGGRRTSMSRFAIENRVGQLLAESQRAAAGRQATSVAHRHQDYFGSLAAGRQASFRPTPQQLEQFASQWADLVPENLGSRVQLFQQLATNYELPHRYVPGLRKAFDADSADFAAELRSRADTDVGSLLGAPAPLSQRVVWGWAAVAGRINALSAFWITLAMVTTSMVGAGVLALPIVFARFDGLTMVVALVLGGLASGMAMYGLAEAIIRSSDATGGQTTIGSLVRQYLGPRSATLVSILVVADLLAIFVGFVYAFGRNMGETTGIPEEAWAIVLVIAVVAMLLRKSLDGTIAVSLTLGSFNLLALVVVMVFALTGFDAANLSAGSSLTGLDGRGSAFLGALFGFVASLYTAQVGVLNTAAVALRKDPQGRGLRLGTLAAIGLTCLIYCCFGLAVSGAVGPAMLEGERATVVGPLADEVGAGVTVIAAVYAPLAIGLISLQFALGIRNQFREWTGRFRRPDTAAIVPVLVAAVVGALLLTSTIDVFVEVFELTGGLVVPVVSIVVPAVLVQISRNRATRWPGHPLPRITFFTTAASVAFGILGLTLHGLVIWESLWRRSLVVLALAAAVWIVVDAKRTNRFRPLLFVGVTPASNTEAAWHLTLLQSGVPAVVESAVTRLGAKGGSAASEEPVADNTSIERQVESLALTLPVGVDLSVAIDSGVSVSATLVSASESHTVLVDPAQGARTSTSRLTEVDEVLLIGPAKPTRGDR